MRSVPRDTTLGGVSIPAAGDLRQASLREEIKRTIPDEECGHSSSGIDLGAACGRQ
jgi:hypothetical protein